MFRYLKQYDIKDMKDMFRNNRTPHHQTTTSMASKTVVIAGATSGVGLAAAWDIARFGGHMVLLARNEAKAKEVQSQLLKEFGGEVSLFFADFSRLAEVHRLAQQLLDALTSIDVLINSAGLHSTRRIITEEGHELVFCVNHLAPFILTYKLAPLLRESSSGRVIQVNSQGHRFGGLQLNDLNWEKRIYMGLRSYGASKTAQLLSVWEFADRLEGTGVTINAMHPGEVRTAIGNNNGPLYRWYKKNVLWRTFKDVRLSGESLRYLAAAPELAGVTGQYFNRTHPEKPAPHALDREVGRLLWKRTLEVTGIDDDF